MNLPISPAAAARALLARRAVREASLRAHAMPGSIRRRITGSSSRNWTCWSGENDTLLVFMPPGSAKSTYVNMLFPAWFLPIQADYRCADADGKALICGACPNARAPGQAFLVSSS
jgi:hypothetical protein